MEVAVEWGPKSICPHSKEALNVARKPNPSVFCAWNALQIVGSSVLQNRLNLQESNKFEWPGSKETNRTNLLGLWILNISEPFAGMEYTNKIKIRSNKYTIESHYFHWIVTKIDQQCCFFSWLNWCPDWSSAAEKRSPSAPPHPGTGPCYWPPVGSHPRCSLATKVGDSHGSKKSWRNGCYFLLFNVVSIDSVHDFIDGFKTMEVIWVMYSLIIDKPWAVSIFVIFVCLINSPCWGVDQFFLSPSPSPL